eukprot:14413619-Ditylum_brightwellii.AAC.1
MLFEIIKTVLEEVSVAKNKVIGELITPNTPSQSTEETDDSVSQKADKVKEKDTKEVAKESRDTGHENNNEHSNKNQEEDNKDKKESSSDEDTKNGSNCEFQPEEEEGNLITREEENGKPKT